MELHRARIDRREKVTYEAAMGSLPDGCFVQIEGRAYLVWNDSLLLWTPGRVYETCTQAGGFDRDGIDAGTNCGMHAPRI